MYGAQVPGLEAENGARPSPRRQVAAAGRFRRQGVALLQEGKFTAAITALRQAVRLDPGDAKSHGALGLGLLRSDRLTEATASLELAIVLEEGVVATQYHLAVALDRQGLKNRAIAAYRRAAELAPELAEAHRRLGELLEAEGDAENAAQSLTKGTRVVISGRLDQRSWETPDHERRSKIEITADEVAPSLRWATCSVTRNERRTPDGGSSYGGGRQVPNEPAGGDSYEDEEPF